MVEADQMPQMVLYGEGYGAGIQKGGGYNSKKSFRLFDVKIGEWWLGRDDVLDVANKLGIATAPAISQDPMTLPEIVAYVQSNPTSIVAAMEGDESHPMEGIVARPIEPLFDRRGKRVIIKLKASDFRAGKR